MWIQMYEGFYLLILLRKEGSTYLWQNWSFSLFVCLGLFVSIFGTNIYKFKNQQSQESILN